MWPVVIDHIEYNDKIYILKKFMDDNAEISKLLGGKHDNFFNNLNRIAQTRLTRHMNIVEEKSCQSNS